MSGEESLESLLDRVALHDRAAFARLYARTSAKLFGVCLRILKERSEAEEALQDAYVKIWRSAGQYERSRARPISWMAAIARNQSIDRLRARRPASDGIEAAETLGDGRPTPEAEAIAARERLRLQACLEELEPRHADAIRAAYFGGHTYATLAERSGVPLGTMKSWIRRGLMRLKDCLER